MLKNKEKLLFILDLDGTTLFDYKKVLPETKATIHKAIDQGHIVSLVTGRPIEGTLFIHKDLELDTLIGVLNGNGIYDPKTDKTDIFSTISSKAISDFINNPETKDMLIEMAIQSKNIILSQKKLGKVLKHWLHDRKCMPLDLNNMPERIQCGILIVKEKDMITFEKHFAQYKDIDIHKWESLKEGNQVYEMFSSAYTKATAVNQIAQYYGIKKENIHVFGDGRNDISMFADNKNTYAMANGHESLKFIAMEILKRSNKENGVGLKMEDILNEYNKK